MRRIAIVLFLLPGLAAAEIRLDLAPMPELLQLEPVYHLTSWDTARDKRQSGGVAATIGVGFGSRDGRAGLVGEGSLLVGKRLRRLTASATSELAAGANELVRGRHTGWLEIRTDDRGPDEDLTAIATVAASVEHGTARGLAPVALAPGKRDHGTARTEVLIGLAPDKDDAVFGVLVQADGSVTRWHAAPRGDRHRADATVGGDRQRADATVGGDRQRADATVGGDRAHRGAFGLGLSVAPFDGELPRGRVDILRVRVEHATIQRRLRAAGIPMHDAQVRTIEVMTGMHELTGWIDRELLVVGTAQLGAVWIESDASAGKLQDTFFEMVLGTHLKWRKGANGRREVGFAWAREPGATPDGQLHVTDWRLEMMGAAEDSRLALSARGGISWITHHAGGVTNPDTLRRYGSHVDAFVKVGRGFEIGGYHAMTFEPQVAGDPWSSARRFVTEAGMLARWRPSTY